ncbi:hypothetical protein ASD38_18800 [Caulobacter sp. Root487D2Y]|uniref:hypothetical protein n=1 Tax=Caulobacter sp. Root487D2Y TaxID=1736547 RepID=UPI0006FC0E71|nr:hypothetical protein [Caulobacter sp. Root487D2Y]KQY27423.1 hypothetical protein ASD38_18800 [Caulobacter sp. Root487D2Y]
MRRFSITAASLVAGLMAAAVAQAADNRCGYGDFVSFAQDGVAVYNVSPPGQGRTYFHNNGEGCPDAPSCRLKSYLVVQDEVLVSKVENGWACAWYGRGDRHTVGWLKKADLVKSAVAPSGEGDWLGDWRFGDNQITIKRTKKGLRAAGDATWSGPVSQHSGAFDGLLEVKGVNAEYADPEGTEPFCDVRMRRVGRHMVVADSGSCGGASVSFDGVYAR